MPHICPAGFATIPQIPSQVIELFKLRTKFRYEPSFPETLARFLFCEQFEPELFGRPSTDPPFFQFYLEEERLLLDLLGPRLLLGTLASQGVQQSNGAIIPIPAACWRRSMQWQGAAAEPFRVAAAGGGIEVPDGGKSLDSVMPMIKLRDLALLLGAPNLPAEPELPDEVGNNSAVRGKGGAPRKIDTEALGFEIALYADGNHLGDNNPNWRSELLPILVKWVADQRDYPGIGEEYIADTLGRLEKLLVERGISSNKPRRAKISP